MSYKKLYLSVTLEVLSILSFFTENIYVALSLFFFFHGLAVFLLTTVLYLFLPKRIRSRKWEPLVFIFLIGFFGFIVGYLFLFILTLYLLRTQRNIEFKPIETFAIEEIEDEDFDFSGRRFGEGAMLSILKEDNVPSELKLRAFMSLSDLQSPITYSLIKENISNPMDEIRLMAFSMISKMEKQLNDKIHELNLRLKDDDLSEEKKAKIYFELAQAYWDFVFFHIVDKEFENYAIEKALYYAEEGLKLKKDFIPYFLIGRIYLRLKDYKKAKEYLELAFNFKEFRYKVIPYLAECYFYERNFKKVKNLFSQLDLSLDVKVSFLKQFWSMQ
jgi:tetratricopeptide (TPR) repeat protein